MCVITLSKGGTAERTIKAADIKVPDLWHVAEWHEEQARLPNVEPWHAMQAKMIKEAWHLLHDLKRHIEEQERHSMNQVYKDIAQVIQNAHGRYNDHAPILYIAAELAVILAAADPAAGFNPHQFKALCNKTNQETTT